MAIKPILFNTEMVRAILTGRKSCTRRICKDANECTVPDMEFYNADKRTYAVHNFADKKHTEQLSIAERTCPICPGDTLYVRETWHKYTKRIGKGESCRLAEFYGYKASVANSEDAEEPWHPSIHMPKEAARIWLRVTDVRVERLQEITPQGAWKEGARCSCLHPVPDCVGNKTAFISIWNRTIKESDIDRYGWSVNPYVFVIEFERCEKPKGVLGMFNNYEELLEEEARIRQQEEDEIKENPLMQYSTSQLKAELRRRKKERC